MISALPRVVLIALGVIAIAGGGYALGRYGAPERTAEDTRAQERVRALTEELTTLKRHTRTETVITYAPTGKPATKTTRTDTHVDRVKTAGTSVDTSRDLYTVKTAESKRPDWKVTGLVGLDAPSLLRGGVVPVYGGLIQRRIVGPFSAGAWGLSTGAVGVSLSVEF